MLVGSVDVKVAFTGIVMIFDRVGVPGWNGGCSHSHSHTLALVLVALSSVVSSPSHPSPLPPPGPPQCRQPGRGGKNPCQFCPMYLLMEVVTCGTSAPGSLINLIP